MKYIDEYRDAKIIKSLILQIKQTSNKPVRLMEVCGGHTMAIRKYGLQNLLPETIELISGPGCPVCVTGTNFIDKAIECSRMPDTIITTYGDLIRVPGSKSSLDKERSKGADIRIVYSTLEALSIAEKNNDKTIVFLGIGFETTIPSTAIAVQTASRNKISNFFVLSAHKLMPPAMSALISSGSTIDGYIGPGHVSTIAGSKIYEPLVKEYGISVVICGFEPADILQGLLMLVSQIENNNPKVDIQYTRAVTYTGNIKAQKIVDDTFVPDNAVWRGIGNINKSGMILREEYSLFDAEKVFKLKSIENNDPSGCTCGEILRGMKKPLHCKLFAKVCTPENPVGACMVSAEGTCAAYYRYC